MKRLTFILIFLSFAFLISCDKSYNYNISVSSSDDILISDVNDFTNKLQKLSFFESPFNHNYLVEYQDIDFTNLTLSTFNYSFFVSSNQDSINYSIYLNNANKYLLDLIRIGVLVNDEVQIYKYYSDNDYIHNNKNDPSNMNYFESKNTIFSSLSLNTKEPTKVTIIVWLENDELYDKNGDRLTGYADFSYNINDVNLSVNLNSHKSIN